MGGGGQTGMKQRSNQRLRKKIMHCEDADEDYVAEADEADVKSDDLDSLVGDSSEEESRFEGEEEDDFDALDGTDDDWRTVVKPKPKSTVHKGFSRSRKNSVNRPNKRIKVTRNIDDDSDDDNNDDDDDDDEFTRDDFEYSMEEEEEADYDEEEGREDEWRAVVKPKPKPKPRSRVQKGYLKSRRNGEKRPKKRRKVTRNDDDDSDEDGDNEFTLDEFEYLMEEEEEEEETDYDEEDESEDEWKTVVKPKPKARARKGFLRSRKNEVNKPKKRRKVTNNDGSDDDDDGDSEVTPEEFENLMDGEEEEETDYEEDGSEGEWDTIVKPKPKSKSRVQNGFSRCRNNGASKPKKRVIIKCDDDDVDDDDDDEFTPGENEYLEEEEEEDDEEFPEAKITKRGTSTLKRRRSLKHEPQRTEKTVRKPLRKRSKRTNSSRKKAESVGDEAYIKTGPILRGRTKRNPGQRKKRMTTVSDSDIRSDSSDYEFTISEEEKEERFKESSLFCRTMATTFRSSRRIREDDAVHEPKEPSARKGKEKAGETKNEIGNFVCGICLTEEGKNTVRGTLDCCSHYFCFTCIMEWSKVETRCPLCKQRFVTISKPTKCGKGFDLRNAVVTVPERDQVYQPSEEELRDILNPYENVICTECRQGGDDALMLLCDVCDSPAHTYCVGLGQDVPEGNWYCDGCRSAALSPSHSQTPDLVPDQRDGAGAGVSDRLSTYENMSEIDLNVTIPETPLLSHVDGFRSSPRYSVGNRQIPSPVSGVGVSTVSGRRRLHRQLQYILSNRPSQTVGDGSNTAFNHHRLDVGTSHHAQQVDRFQENDFRSVQNTDFGRLGNMTGHVGQPVTAADCSSRAQLPASDPHRPCTSRSSTGPDTDGFLSENLEEEHANFVRQEIRSTVRNQLQSMSREMNLGKHI
ncbi:hypothetical protein RND81_12G159100 [Saponaria officinalis]|uniref:PHD and RING finger domain-containing protein 1 n=1 Tax=Saponaria officinalis TaxID=3572 RepID=A0AAW1HBA1_SAPOF